VTIRLARSARLPVTALYSGAECCHCLHGMSLGLGDSPTSSGHNPEYCAGALATIRVAYSALRSFKDTSNVARMLRIGDLYEEPTAALMLRPRAICVARARRSAGHELREHSYSVGPHIVLPSPPNCSASAEHAAQSGRPRGRYLPGTGEIV